MPYEDFDKKVRDAADHHHPAYDEQAWGKMESLLDTHMPVEKQDRRRFIFFLLFFLLLGGALVLLTKPWSSGTSIAAKEKPNAIDTKQGTSVKEDRSPVNTSPAVSETISQKEIVQQNILPQTDEQTKTTGNSNNIIQKKNSSTANFEYSSSSSSVSKKNKVRQNTVTATIPISSPAPENTDPQATAIANKKNDIPANQNNSVAAKNTTNNISPVASDKEATRAVAEPVLKKEDVAQQKEPKKEKPKSARSNSFFLTLSAGPDVSAAGGEKLGKTKLLAGLGLGYTFKDKLTIRTGFYSGRKVYAASPDEYNPPADFWNFYPYLEKVEADCKVYEIPVSLSYNFGRSTKFNWFASAGLSTYLMKKEEYNYYYKYLPNTPTLNAKWTVHDENKHFFSVVTLSGGFQRKINRSVSLMVEPYVKLPLSGVGYGKVKLNSGGVLMTLAISPFQKNTKEK